MMLYKIFAIEDQKLSLKPSLNSRKNEDFFALNNLNNNFHTTVFIDESTVWTLRGGLYHHRRKSSFPKANTIHPPHPVKVQIFGGISWDGPIPFKIFTRNLDGEFYMEVLDETLVPFMRDFNGGNCRFLQDNAPSHVTSAVYNFLSARNLSWV